MNTYLSLALTLSQLLYSLCCSAQIPTNPNHTDAQGLRQGKWTILFDKDWNKVKTYDSTSYYRIIEYVNDRPVNEVHDYFKSGQIKSVATFISDKPILVVDINKPITHYFEDGSKDAASVLSDKGNYYREKGQYDKALPLFKKAKDLMAKLKGKESKEYIFCVNDLARLFHSQSNFGKAKPLYIEVKDLQEKIAGKLNTYYAAAVDNLALLYDDMGEYKTAESLFKEALDIRKNVFGKETDEYAYSLHNLASHYTDLGNYKYAETMVSVALPIWERIEGKEGEGYLISLNLLALIYTEQGNYTQAEPLFLQIKEVQARIFGKLNPAYSVTLNNLGLVYHSLGRYSDAEALYKESLHILEKTSGKETLDYTTGLNNLAYFYFEAGDLNQAQKYFLVTQKTIEKLVGKIHPDYATCIDNFGSVYIQLGDYKNAELLKKEALEIRLKLLGKMNVDYAASLESMGGFYDDVGNYQKASELFLEAKNIWSKVLGKLNPHYALALSNLAVAYQNDNQFSKAEEQLIEAKMIYEKTLGTDHPDYAIILSNLASIYGERDYAKMESLYLQARAINEKTFGKESAAYASSLLDLGDAYEKLGKDHLAESCYLEAKEIIGKILGKNHPDYADALYDLASFYSLNNKNDKAEPYYQELVTRTLDRLDRYFPLFSDQEKKLFYNQNEGFLSEYKLFCIEQFQKNPALLSHLYDLTLKTKGILFHSSDKIRKRIMASKNQILIDQYKAWKSKRELLSKVYKMSSDDRKKLGLSEKKILEECNEIEKKLSMASENYSMREERNQYTWQDVRSKLKEGEVAIEVIRTEQWMQRQEGKWKHTYLGAIYIVLLVTPETNNQPDIILFKNGNDLEGKFIRYYHNAMKQQQLDTISYAHYWRPIADKIQGARKVYFSADGVYNQLNLNTLYNSATGKYVLDETEVHVVTSTKEIIVNTKAAKATIKDATLFGYPNYNNSKNVASDSTRSLDGVLVNTLMIKSDSAQRFFNGEYITELPGTKVEVETIETLLRKKNIALQEFIYDYATESEIKRVNNPQVLHIATHGFFLSKLPSTQKSKREFAGIETKKIAENPMLRSGLLFAGVKNAFASASGPANNEGEDGILTAFEAMSLDLNETDLVVMSACETGLGVTANGEGVYGLQRAFQVAGAKSVLMSLWSVSDEATQQLMTMFYGNWLDGNSPREAFRLAQLSLRKKYLHPYFWGAFVLVGN